MRKAYSIKKLLNHSASFPKQASVHQQNFFMVLDHVLPLKKKQPIFKNRRGELRKTLRPNR